MLIGVFCFLFIYGCQESQFDERFDPRLNKDPANGAGGGSYASWLFASSSDYTFTSSHIGVSGNKAELKQVDTALDSAADFTAGNHLGTAFSGGALKLKTGAASTLDLDQLVAAKAANIKGYWKMENSWADSTANANTGTAQNGAAFTGDAALDSWAGKFDGANDYVNLTSNASLQSSELTYMGWVRLNATGANQSIIAWSAAGGPQLRIGSGNLIEFVTQGGATIATGTTTLSSQSWYHVAVTHDSSKNWNIYLNGALEKSGTSTAAAFAFSTMRMGGVDAATHLLNGYLDEVSAWDTTLTAAEINTVYEAQKSRFADDKIMTSQWAPKFSSLIGYWRLDGNWLDSSGNGRNGTPGTAAVYSSTFAKIGSHSAETGPGNSPGTLGGIGAILNGASTFTFSWWARSTGTGGRILSEPSSAGIFIAQSGSTLQLAANSGLVAAAVSCSACNDAQGRWYHHVLTVYGGTYYWYVNGELNRTGATTGNLILPNNLTVGGQNSGSSRWPGHVDEFAIWSTGLTREEVLTIYHRQKQMHSGQYESAVFDLGSSSATWTKLTPVTALPFLKELPSSSEAAAAYSGISANLATSLAALWHFNESSWNGTAGEATEELGTASGVRVGNSQTVAAGAFDRGASFDGNTDGVNLSDRAALEFTGTQKTFSFWAKLTALPSAIASSYTLLSKWNITGNNREWSLYIDSADNLLKFTKSADGTGSNGVELGAGQQSGVASTYAFSTTDMGVWTHITVTIAADGTVSFYVNGKAAGSGALANTTFFAGTANAFVGCIASNGTACGNSMRGQMDEIAVWNRTLASAEVLQLYRRGANRVKYQVKSCGEATCSCKTIAAGGSTADCSNDGTANDLLGTDANQAIWLGPDGSAATYFSELQNYNSVVNGVLSGGVSTAASDHVFANFPAAARPGDNRYFRFRAFLESDDENAACGGTNCLPELTSATISPTGRYYAGSPSISNVTGISYTKAKTFVVSRAGSCTPTYQISNDGTSFFYWNAGAWAAATISAQSSFEGDIHANISSFPAGDLHFKAFLPSDMSQSCEIRSIISEIER